MLNFINSSESCYEEFKENLLGRFFESFLNVNVNVLENYYLTDSFFLKKNGEAINYEFQKIVNRFIKIFPWQNGFNLNVNEKFNEFNL
jgi:hypothetical protein